MCKLIVRFANDKELDWIVKNEDIPKNIIKRKIEEKEMIVVKIQDNIMGFIRIEFIW